LIEAIPQDRAVSTREGLSVEQNSLNFQARDD
jgi:hypothetical protein